MAVENDAVVVDVCHESNEDTVLFEEVSRLKAISLSELAIIGLSCVDIGFFFGILFEASKDNQFVMGDLKGTHVKLRFRQSQFKKLPAVLTLRKSFDAGTWQDLA